MGEYEAPLPSGVKGGRAQMPEEQKHPHPVLSGDAGGSLTGHRPEAPKEMKQAEERFPLPVFFVLA